MLLPLVKAPHLTEIRDFGRSVCPTSMINSQEPDICSGDFADCMNNIKTYKGDAQKVERRSSVVHLEIIISQQRDPYWPTNPRV